MKALPENRRNAETGKKLLDLINTNYAVHWADHTRPYPGIPELLDALTARAIKITVLSNKADDLTNICVTKLLARWHFCAGGRVEAKHPEQAGPGRGNTIGKASRHQPDRIPLSGRFGYRYENRRRGRHVSHRSRLGFPFRTGTARRGRESGDKTTGRTAGVFVK